MLRKGKAQEQQGKASRATKEKQRQGAETISIKIFNEGRSMACRNVSIGIERRVESSELTSKMKENLAKATVSTIGSTSRLRKKTGGGGNCYLQ